MTVRLLTPGMKFAQDRRLEATLRPLTQGQRNRRDRNAQYTVDYCRLIAFLRFSFARRYLVPSPRRSFYIPSRRCTYAVLHECRTYIFVQSTLLLFLSLFLYPSLSLMRALW